LDVEVCAGVRLPRALVIPDWERPFFGRVECLLIAIFALSLYGEAFPYGVPLVLPITVIGFVWFALIKRTLSVPINLGFALFVICFCLYLLGVIRTARVYEHNSRDLRNAVCVLLVSVLLFSRKALPEFRSFRDGAQLIGAVAGTTLAIIGLYKFHLMVNGQKIHLLFVKGYPYPWGTSLIDDYNFYALAILCGAISCLFYLFRCSSITAKVMCIVGLCLNVISLSLSGSRRGWVTEILLLVAVLICLIRWLARGLGRFHLSSQVFSPGFKTVAAVVIVAVIGPIFMRYQPAFLDSRRGTSRSALESLQFRFGTLRDPEKSFGERTDRWEYSTQLLNHASPFELLFGQGFDYLRLFVVSFDTKNKDNSADATLEDYPHNPLISAALYSGVVGSSAVLFFILIALFRYVKHRKTDTYFLALYFASLWFILPSYNSIFSGKCLGFLLLIPWSMQQTKHSTVRTATSGDLVHSQNVNLKAAAFQTRF
jgi:hypothetical protein